MQGLLQNGFLDDALPILQALNGMIEDADIAYNLGICLSELGRTAESVEPLEGCTRLAPNYTNAWVGLGVAYTRLNRATEAMRALNKAVEQQPTNSFAQRNLGALLSKEGKHDEALPHFRQAVAQAPNDPAAAFGLCQCLHALGGEHRKEADPVYSDLIKRFPDSPVAEMARQALTQLAQDSFRDNADGGVRMDAVFYMMEAWGLPRDKMPRYQEILDKYGSVSASPYKIDTASFVVETRYGVWGAQVPLKPKGYSKKKRTFGPVELQLMDGVEGRFVGLLPEPDKQSLR